MIVILQLAELPVENLWLLQAVTVSLSAGVGGSCTRFVFWLCRSLANGGSLLLRE